EGRGILGVGHLFAGEGREPGELAPAALTRRLCDRRVDVVGEELERRLLVVLLPLEEQRRTRREEAHGERDAMSVARQAVAERAVADLVVVLRTDHEPLRPGPRQLADEPLH